MDCYACGYPQPTHATECPHCGTPVRNVGLHVRWSTWLAGKWNRRLSVMALVLLLFPLAPRLVEAVQLSLPLHMSVLVSEALARASEDDGVAGRLGLPLQASWSVDGYIRKSEAGWHEASLSIPISGTRGEATLRAEASHGSGLWVFTTLEVQATNGETIDLLAKNAEAPQELAVRGRVYLVPLGMSDGTLLTPYRDYYRVTHGLDVDVLPPIAVDPISIDPQRGQVIAEALIAAMRRSLPQFEADATATVIGVTQQDMYIAALPWAFAFNFRSDDRFAVVSIARMVPSFNGLWPRDGLFASRLRKMLTKNVGILTYGLPLNDDPTSLLYRGIGGVADLDLVQERFEGLGRRAVISPTVVTHRASPLEPEIRRNRTAPTETVESSYPCFVMSPLIARKVAGPVHAEVTTCTPGMRTERAFDELEIDLRSGLLITRKTDVFADDSLPLALTRSYRTWDSISRAFGIGGNHPYDILPVGSRYPYTYVDLVMADGSLIHYARISEGTGYADALYEHAADTPFRGSTFRWNGNGWDLRLADGGLFRFPENYAGVRPSQGAPTGMQDAAGHQIRFERDRDRNLKRLTSPNGHVIAFDYDDAYRVTQATDDRGRVVRYDYDAGGRLAAVREDTARVQYAYLGTLLTEITADDGERSLLLVTYDQRRVQRIDLDHERWYRFDFSFESPTSQRATHVAITGSDGSTTQQEIARRN
jgi:YD repeat-containing protein